MAMSQGKRHAGLVCAIDFGTSYSGYAYGNKADLDNIHINKEWGNTVGLPSYKTATTVLTTAEGAFEDFGFNAEKKYAELLARNDAHNMDLYKHFKMLLHGESEIYSSTIVKSTRGSPRPVIDVFIMALKYLKEHFMEAYERQHGSLNMGEVLWVLTVPAIWSDKSKGFMREAAYKAKLIKTIDSPQLLFALEPEAAALYCQALHTDSFRGTENMPANQPGLLFDVNTSYLIIDAGGGTIDIAAQEVLPDGKVKELIPPSGGIWGGNQINHQFELKLEEKFGKVCITKFKKRHPNVWHELEIDFEKKKRATRPDGCSEISFSILKAFDVFVSKEHGLRLEEINNEETDLVIRDDYLVINPSAVLDLYFSNIQNINEHLEKVLKDPKLKKLQYIFLVGGYAESDHLFKAISTRFQSKHMVLSPENCSTAILKGAVIFGLNPERIVSRIARKTYGFCVRRPFEDGVDDISKIIYNVHRKAYCDMVFREIVTKGDEIEVGKENKISTNPFQPDARYITKRLYYSDKEYVKYCDEESVYKLGELRLDLPASEAGRDREIRTTIVFSGTEIKVKAKDKISGNTVETTMGFESDPST